MIAPMVKSIKYLSKILANTFGNVQKSVDIKQLTNTSLTPVDVYWGEHTVNSVPFKTADESLKYLQWRSEQYPAFHEFMQLYGNHDDQVVLDYGCGPGNDLVGFLVYTNAKEVIGIDVSEKALGLAMQRLAL